MHAVIVPSEDPHQSEYSAACYERRQYISRFTVRNGSHKRVPVAPGSPRRGLSDAFSRLVEPRVSFCQGSAGTAVVTMQAALLWTDGRYFLQVRPSRNLTCPGGGRVGNQPAFLAPCRPPVPPLSLHPPRPVPLPRPLAARHPHPYYHPTVSRRPRRSSALSGPSCVPASPALRRSPCT